MRSDLFSGTPAGDYFIQRIKSIKDDIDSLSENEILNIGVEQYSDYLQNAYEEEFPVIEEEKITISSYETEIHASDIPQEFPIYIPEKRVKKNVIVFHVPFIGAIRLLLFKPTTLSTGATTSVRNRNNEILFEYYNFYDDPDIIQRAFDSDFANFKRRYELLKSDFNSYNAFLKGYSVEQINKRKDEILTKNNFLASFNVPLKYNENAPKTFAVPAPKLREKISIARPQSSNQNFVAEPTLSYDQYVAILKTINDVGKNFERLPFTYKGKEEEDLRDHILFVLDPLFEYGSASGETFNKSGKTDISLRYDSSVVFIAECKFWAGPKVFPETIDQLLSYLTWRDSKTAIILFVRNKEITSVLEKLKEQTLNHQNCVSLKRQIAENWHEYIFNLPIDNNKEMILSILVFHLVGG